MTCFMRWSRSQVEIKPPTVGGPGDPDAWVCEKHPDKPFPHGECDGPGMLRRDLP